jgi:putative ABC transport system permease protein
MGVKGRWFRGGPSDDEMREELEAHVAMRAEHDRVDVSVARRRLGNVLQTREAMRRVWIAQWWDALRQDAHYTWRSWRRRPAFALAAIGVLALGLGSSTALFAALDRVLFRPLPYADPDRLVSVGLLGAPGGPLGDTETVMDKAYAQVWRSTPAPFESVAAMDTWTCDIAEERPERVRCGPVDHTFLRVLGVSVALGRDFVPEDDVRGAPRVGLISHGLWVRRYGALPDVIGSTLNLDTGTGPIPHVRIVGVLPRDFEMPVEAADILLPSQLRPFDARAPFGTLLMAIARLKPGVTPERAKQMLAPQLPEMLAFWPQRRFDADWSVRPLHDRRVGDAARIAWLLMGAVAIFLLIACLNVTNLMLARLAERQREFAVRAAVGAGTLRLARLALAESLLLSFVAGGIGLLVAFALLRSFAAMAPADVPGALRQSLGLGFIADASIDVRVCVVGGALVLVAGLAIGLWPAISLFRATGLPALGSTRSASPGARPGVRFALVTTQIALTLALLGGSALLLRSLWNVVNVPLGFDGARVVTMTAWLSSATKYQAGEHRAAFFEDLLARARGAAGTVTATLSDAPAPPRPPLTGTTDVGVEGRPSASHARVGIREVTPQFFETFGIPLVEGRTLHETDWVGHPAAVLNQSAKRILFAGEHALGRRIRPRGTAGDAAGTAGAQWYSVVGVTTDVRNGQRVTDTPDPEIYVVARRGTWGRIGRLSLRTTAGAAETDALLRTIAADLDPTLLVTIDTVDGQVERLTAQPRFVASLLTAFAVLALMLAAIGLYSVASYLVAQRRRDIGVRMAIGASPRDVARQVVAEAARWIIGGAVVGSVLGWMGTRALQSQLYQVEPLDPWSWTGALLALALVLVMAVFRPAYRAAHVDPVAALKAD